jgi:hypothetical protein
MQCCGTGTGTVNFQKSEPEPELLKIVTVPQHCLYALLVKVIYTVRLEYV